MKRSRNLNMTEGNIPSLLIYFAIPMLIGNLFQQAYNLADSAIVGRFVGASALAAVGSTGSVTFLFFSICNGISSGSAVVTAQYYGAGDVRRIKRALTNSAYLMFVAAMVMGLSAFFAAPSVLRLMGTPEDILPDAITYMRMSCIGVPLVAVYNYASSMLRSLGDSRTPLYFLIVACFLNVGMDLLFVCVFHMGVFGAALATVIAQLLSGVGCLWYAARYNPYFLLEKQDWQVDRDVIFHSLKLGLPLALQWSMISVSTSVLQSFVNGFGTTAMAAFTTTSRIEQLVQQPYGSLSAALSTFAGQNYGAKRMDRVKNGLKYGMIISAIFTLLMIIPMRTFSEGIVSIFVTDEAVIAMGSRAMRLTSWFYIFLALIYMCRGILNGIGDAMFAFINGVVEVACRIVLPMVVVMVPGIGLWGIWWTAGLTWMFSGITCLMRYVVWRRKADRQTEEVSELQPE